MMDGQTVTWIPVEQEMPPSGLKVLFCYKNDYGNWRRTCGYFAKKHTIEAIGWDEGVEPDTDDDGVDFEPEGWYEIPVESEYIFPIINKVTHWMYLPLFPGAVPAVRLELPND
jgi:hypothetical protein